MSRRTPVSLEDKQTALAAYIKYTKCSCLNMQIEAIKNVMCFFSSLSFANADIIFIQHFPTDVYGEFEKMSEGETNVDHYQQKKILFFNVFNFIFRNGNLSSNSRAKSFIKLFLKFIKIRKENEFHDPKKVIVSIQFCIIHEPNKVPFINENGMLNFLYYFYDLKAKSTKLFWEICKSIYKLNVSHRSSLIPLKLTESVSQIMSKFFYKKDCKCLRILNIVLLMLCRLKLLNEIELDFDNFYNVTDMVYKKKVDKNNIYMFLNDLSKIWVHIIKGTSYKLEIDTIPKLLFFAAIFATYLSNKLNMIIQSGGKFEVKTKIKQKLYIIYFALVAYPIFDETGKRYAPITLQKLHYSFQDYIQKYSIEDFTIENQFVLLQYYIKSHVSLNIPISPRDKSIFEGFLEKMILYPSLSTTF
ncbi:hypothetical protein RF11_10583 [Thelohanellus kitauei]|uniref:Uncharacterized protein n=1 Tax=Thelohanellus kitauei TaxID=669202 RepID=A0A0C2NKI3_THEKT|nr:hypothetical protein RF11_10583 [Thelohanellus kitauei]